MTQRFFLREATAGSRPSNGEKSVVLPVDTLQAENASGVLEEGLALNAAIGPTQVSIAHNTDATTAARDGYHARYTSLPLAAGTFGVGSWTLAMAVQQSNNQANTFMLASLYFWRPSTQAVVGFIFDSHTNIGNEWRNGEEGEVNNITGANVTIIDLDVLVFEFWRHQTQSMSTSRVCTIFYNGAVLPVDEVSISNAGSFIDAPVDIPEFQGVIKAGGIINPQLTM